LTWICGAIQKVTAGCVNMVSPGPAKSLLTGVFVELSSGGLKKSCR
jgi:hypothetical protein